MDSYASIADFRAVMKQVPSEQKEPGVEGHIQDVLDSATNEIDLELGFSFAGYVATASERDFDSRGGRLLHLPYHQAGSLAAVALVYADTGRPQAPVYSSLTLPAAWPFTDYRAEWDDHTVLWRATGWLPGRYSATAKWGYGDPPKGIVRVCVERAVNEWLGSQGGQFSDVVGVEGGGAVGYKRAWTDMQRGIIAATRLKYGDVGFA